MDGLSPAFTPALLSRIEDAGLNASAPPQQRWVDGWLLRFSPGKAKRARCINAVAEGRLPLEERLALCAAVFDQAELPMVVRITPFTRPADLDGVLAARGMTRLDDTRVMALAGYAPPSPAVRDDVTIQSVGLEAFAQRVGSLRGSPLSQRQAHAERLRHSPVPFHAFELRHEGEAVACGQYAIEGSLVGLYDVYTAESARGRGHARLLCEHLLHHAHRHGARDAYLQVEADNAPARAIYHRLGFIDGYAYHYRAAPGA